VPTPRLEQPEQVVDMRAGYVAPGLELIADARGKTYLAMVRFGLLGLASVRLVPEDEPAIGNCFDAGQG
jgi:hypothetical protein